MKPQLRVWICEAVMQAYGFKVSGMTESMCVAELMKMYQKLAEKH